MKVAISNDGRMTIPAKIRTQDDIQSGQSFEIQRLSVGTYLLRRVEPSLVDLLLSCPVKGWFRPLESESTDTIGTYRT